jgi:hypothetical protein
VPSFLSTVTFDDIDLFEAMIHMIEEAKDVP